MSFQPLKSNWMPFYAENDCFQQSIADYYDLAPIIKVTISNRLHSNLMLSPIGGSLISVKIRVLLRQDSTYEQYHSGN